MSAEEFSLTKFLENPIYARKFEKYLKRNIFLDTYPFCLIILGKFDENYNYNTLDAESDSFMNIDTQKKLIRIVDRYRGKLVITPAVVVEGLNHMFTAVEKKYGVSREKKEIEEQFASFLQTEIGMFREKHPLIKEMLTHNWTEIIKHHKLRNRFELGDLSIFVESDKCEYATIITNDAFKIEKKGQFYMPENTIIIQLNILEIS